MSGHSCIVNIYNIMNVQLFQRVYGDILLLYGCFRITRNFQLFSNTYIFSWKESMENIGKPLNKLGICWEERSVITSKTGNQDSFLLVEPVCKSVTHPTAETQQNPVTRVEKSLWTRPATAAIVYKPAVASVFVTTRPCSWLRASFSWQGCWLVRSYSDKL